MPQEGHYYRADKINTTEIPATFFFSFPPFQPGRLKGFSQHAIVLLFKERDTTGQG